MNDHSNSKNSKDPTDSAESEEWEFNIQAPKVAEENSHKRAPIAKRKQEGLVLDQASAPKTRTRSAMAQELDRGIEKHPVEEFNLASYFSRGLAFIFDTLFLFASLFTVKFSTPIIKQIIQYGLDNYKYKINISDLLFSNIVMGVSSILIVFFIVVIPVAFFNTCLGKKIFGLRVRGSGQYTLTINEAFKREIIFKPLSVLLLIGFITPFFSEKRLSLHDMLARTMVVTD